MIGILVDPGAAVYVIFSFSIRKLPKHWVVSVPEYHYVDLPIRVLEVLFLRLLEEVLAV